MGSTGAGVNKLHHPTEHKEQRGGGGGGGGAGAAGGAARYGGVQPALVRGCDTIGAACTRGGGVRSKPR
jgi:hypothetical protein